MLSFKQYIAEEYVDWDYVFSSLMEETEPIPFKEMKGKKDTLHTHDTEIDGNPVRVTVLHKHSSNAHHVVFSVGGDMSAGNVENMSPQTRSKILAHVGKAVRSYVDNVVKKLPGQHDITFSPFDKDVKKEGKKQSVQKRFAERLAAAGGKYSVARGDTRNDDSHTITYDNENPNT
jgi:hypothetical protein